MPEPEGTEETATKQAIPITIWLVIGGGVLLLGAIGVIVVVVRKKKKDA